MLCPNCQNPNPDGARFCSSCGQALEQARPRQPEGERKFVTVLFADVVGSTAMGERLDPEQITDLMNGAFAFLNESVARYGGTVSRLMGDAVLAIFGAPVAHEDDPERAIRAGLDIQAAAAEYAQAVKGKFDFDFRVRVGIHTGLAVLAPVGDRIRSEYTAMGDTPNVAARMQSAASPGTVLVSGETHRLARHAFDFTSRGGLEVKGKQAPVDAFEVVGVKAAPERGRGLEGLSAPLVGREAEFERLAGIARSLRPGGTGAFVAVLGEAGLGKSRLLAELRQSVASNPTSPVNWLEGRSISYGQSMSYYPWRQILRRAIGANEAEPPEQARAKLGTAAQAWGLAGESGLILESLLGVAAEGRFKPGAVKSDEDFVQSLAAAVRAALRGASLAQPLIVVFEDLHWADQASVDLLGLALDLCAEHPIVFISLMRPDREARSWPVVERAGQALGEGRVEVIELEALSVDQSRELLAALLHVEDLPESVRQVILARSEGNPFYVEEVIRSLLDAGYIVRQEGRWRATGAIVNAAIPSTLAGLLAARIDALPEASKRTAQTSAVLGRSFAQPLLEAVDAAGPEADRLHDFAPHLARLVRDDILRERAVEPVREYTFKHALTQEAAYNSLLIRRRKELHLRAGQALEGLYAGRLEEQAATLAHHFWQAEAWGPAARYAERAGAASQQVYALREAMGHYDRAIEALDKEGGAQSVELYDAIMGWAGAAFKFKPYAEQLARLKRAEALARDLDDKRRLAESLLAVGKVYQASGRNLLAVGPLAQCFALAEELGDEELAATPSYSAAFMKMDADPQASLPMFDRAIALARKYANRDLEAYGLSSKGMALARLGRFAESQAVLQQAGDIVNAGASPVTAADVELFAGWAYLDMGDAARGLEHGRRGVERAIATDSFDCICGGYACVGFAQLQGGKLEDASAAFQEGIRHSEYTGAVLFENMNRGGLALAGLIEGREEALAALVASVAQAQELGDLYTVALFSQAAGEAYLSLHDPATAQGFIGAALTYYRNNNLTPQLGRILVTQASLYDSLGQPEAAAEARAEAAQLAAGGNPSPA